MKPTCAVSAFQNSKFREGAPKSRFFDFGGESKFNKVFRDGFPPPAKNPSSEIWSAKERGGSGGGKTSANLVAKCAGVVSGVTRF